MKILLIAHVALCTVGIGAGSAQTTTPATQPVHAPSTPGKIAGVDNFAKISPILFRGDQPTAEGFAELKKLGVRTIISLRTFHGDGDLLKGTSLRYIRITAKAYHPEEEDLVVFLKILSDPANQPVFVHCQQGADRTGYMVASYRIVEQGWTRDEAMAELNAFDFHKVWTKVPLAIGALNVAEILQKVEKANAPTIETIK